MVWIPELTSPMNIFSLELKSNLCFAQLIKVQIDSSKAPESPESLVTRPGIDISVFGQTEKTKVLPGFW